MLASCTIASGLSAEDGGTLAVASLAADYVRVNEFDICETDTVSGLLVVKGPGTFAFSLSGFEVNVNWTRVTYLESGKPTNLSDPQGRFQVSQTYGDELFRLSTGESSLETAASYIKPTDFPSKQFRLAKAPLNLSIEPANGSTVSGPHFSLPSGSMQATNSKGNMTFNGSFSIVVGGGMRVTMRDKNHERSFETGNWTEPLGPSPPGQPQPSRYRHFQELRLDITNGRA